MWLLLIILVIFAIWYIPKLLMDISKGVADDINYMCNGKDDEDN